MKLNLDLLHIICQYVPVTDIPKVAISLYPGISANEIESIKCQTRDPSIFFEDLMDSIPTLMRIMEMTGVHLIGMKAFSYFHYMEQNYLHPWQFICTGNPFYYLSFIDHLESRGVMWDHIKSHSEYDGDNRIGLDRSMFSITGHVYSNSKLIFIELIWKIGDENVFNIISDFGMTPLQCFITADGAFDRYGKLHAQKKFRLWKKSTHNNSPGWEPSLFGAMNVCQDHDFKPISFETHRNYNPWSRPLDRARHLTDGESMYSKFKSSTNLIDFKREFSSITWIESQYESMPCSEVLREVIEYNQLRELYNDLEMPLMDKVINAIYGNVDMTVPPLVRNPSWYWNKEFNNLLTRMGLNTEVPIWLSFAQL